MLAVFGVILLRAYCFAGSGAEFLTPDGTRLSGQDAVRCDQKTAERYEGDLTDEKIVRMTADFAEKYPEEYELLKSGLPISGALPSSYLYLSMFIPVSEYMDAVSDYMDAGSDVRDRGTERSDYEDSTGLLTANGTISLSAYDAAFSEKPYSLQGT